MRVYAGNPSNAALIANDLAFYVLALIEFFQPIWQSLAEIAPTFVF